eukprot:7755457-Alexandrium_andersonii.AAC.1
MDRMYKRIKADPRCAAVTNASNKNTIEFRYAELKVDFTVHVGDTAAEHNAMRSTIKVRDKLGEFPPGFRDFAAIVVDWAKQAG